MKVIKIGITGHRNLADEAFVQEAITDVISKILVQNNAETFEAITGLAYGADTLFARIAKEKFKAQIKIILPFSLSEYEKDFDTDQRVKELRRWCDQFPPEVPRSIEGKSLDRKEKNEAYLNCGKKIVDTCDYLIAVWNGKPSSGASGTQIIVDYARSAQKKLEIIFAYKNDEITPKIISDLLAEKDQKALALKSQYEKYWRWGIVTGIIAVYTLIFPFCFKMDSYYSLIFSILEALMVLMTFILASKANNKISKVEKITSRIEAERLRVLLVFSKANIPVIKLEDQSDILPMMENSYLGNPDHRLIQIENYLVSHSIHEKEPSKFFTPLMDLIENQIEYHLHGERIKKIVYKHKIENKLSKILTYFFVFGVSLHLLSSILNVIHTSFDTHILHNISVFVILGVPPLFAGMELWKYFEEWERSLSDAMVMANFFHSQKKQLLNQSDQIVSIAHNIREVMSRENSTWKYMMISKVMHGIA